MNAVVRSDALCHSTDEDVEAVRRRCDQISARDLEGTLEMDAAPPILPSDISTENVFFTFPSGSLAYDCASCGSTYCRGHGFSMNRDKELPVLLGRDSSLQLFITDGDGDAAGTHSTVRNCPPGCFVLENDGLCEIQLEHGYAAKPETCRLFPSTMFSLSEIISLCQPTARYVLSTSQEKAS